MVIMQDLLNLIHEFLIGIGSEFTIVFSDLVSTYKEGVIYLDDISFLHVKEGDEDTL